VIYCRAGFCERFLAWPSGEPIKPRQQLFNEAYIAPTPFAVHCTNSFSFHLSPKPTLHQRHLPKVVMVTLGGIFVKEFCYTSGNHASVWAKFCSPSKTAKLAQISIGLPERASKNAATKER